MRPVTIFLSDERYAALEGAAKELKISVEDFVLKAYTLGVSVVVSDHKKAIGILLDSTTKANGLAVCPEVAG